MSDGIAPITRILRLWDNAFPVSPRTGKYTVHSSTPSTGQMNYFHFRGAIQALSTAQIGQRGKSVGQS